MNEQSTGRAGDLEGIGSHAGGFLGGRVPRFLRRPLRLLHGFYAVAGALLSAGLLMALLALWALSLVTEDVLEGETLPFDEGILLWMNGVATPGLTSAAMHVTMLGAGVVTFAIALTAGTLLWLLDQRRYAVLIGAAVGGASIISPALKALFGRPRPALFESPVPEIASSAYPSGHTVMGTVTWMVLAYTVYRLASRRRWVSAAAVLIAALIVILVGLSRIYLGVHYPTDVLAGIAVGFVWAVFCTVSVEAYPFGRGRPRDAGARP